MGHYDITRFATFTANVDIDAISEDYSTIGDTDDYSKMRLSPMVATTSDAAEIMIIINTRVPQHIVISLVGRGISLLTQSIATIIIIEATIATNGITKSLD